MKDRVIVLYDSDIEYANNLMGFLNHKPDFPFLVKVVTTKESFIEMIGQDKIALVMVDVSIFSEVSPYVSEKRVLVLAEEDGKLGTYEKVFRYQTVEKIIRRIMEVCGEQICFTNQFTKRNIYGVYSPVGGIGKTGISAAIAQYFSEKSKVLLFSFSLVQENIFKCEEVKDEGLLRLLLKIKDRSLKDEGDLMSYCERIGQLYFLQGSCYQGELWNLTTDDINYFFQYIEEYDFFQIIIFDIGFLNDAIIEVMRHCDIIYLLGGEKKYQSERIGDFYKLLRFREETSIEQKIQEVIVEKNILEGGVEERYFDNLAIREFVKRLVGEDGEE